jgi:hypothetical protein
MTRFSNRLLVISTLFTVMIGNAVFTSRKASAAELNRTPTEFSMTGYLSTAGFGSGSGETPFLGRCTLRLDAHQVTFSLDSGFRMVGTYTLDSNAGKGRVYGTFHLKATPQDSAQRQLLFTVSCEIEGGTNRFKWARGHLSGTGLYDTATGKYKVTVSESVRLYPPLPALPRRMFFDYFDRFGRPPY